MKLEYSRQSFEKYTFSNFTKICLVGAQYLHMDRGTDRETRRK